MHASAHQPGPRISILVDGENISADNWPAIGEVFSGLGKVVTLTCFADFNNPSHANWRGVCRAYGGTPVMVPKAGRKNGTDIALTIAAMEMLLAKTAEMFVIVSSDSDFAPLAQRISSAGCIAVGIGHETANEELKSAFDRYAILPRHAAVPAPNLAPEPAAPPGTSKPSSSSPAHIAVLKALVARLARENIDGAVPLSHLGSVLQKEHPDLATLLAKGRLRKALRRYQLAEESGAGTAIRVAPRKTAVQTDQADLRRAG